MNPAQAAETPAPAEASPASTSLGDVDSADDPSIDADADTTATDAPDGVVHRRRIRSFVTRAGRLSTGQQRAIDALSGRFVLPHTTEAIDWPTVFGRTAPRIFEIGFGMGATTAGIAARRPDDDFIGVEVHEPGVGALLKLIEERALPNIRILQHDAVEVLEQQIEDGSLDGVHIYFPDPWHKARHNKRRLVQPPFVALLVRKMRPGGYLHLATDWEPYAEQMLEVLRANADLRNTATDYAPRPDYRPTTKFEQRGLNLGHGVWDLVFTRI